MVGMAYFHFKFLAYLQGRRRLFKSGPAEEAIECRESTLGGFGGPPPSKFLNFERFYVRF